MAHHPGPKRRVVAATLAVLGALLSADVGRAAHLLVVAHVRCGVHGDLLHAATAPEGAAGLDARRTLRASDEAADAHDHCGTTAIGTTPRLLSPPCEHAPPARALGATSDTRAARGPHAQDLLSLAPKTSPPA